MPIFEYECPKCETVFEELASAADRDMPQTCTTCGAKNAKRILSLFSARVSGGSKTSSSCTTCKPKPSCKST